MSFTVDSVVAERFRAFAAKKGLNMSDIVERSFCQMLGLQLPDKPDSGPKLSKLEAQLLELTRQVGETWVQIQTLQDRVGCNHMPANRAMRRLAMLGLVHLWGTHHEYKFNTYWSAHKPVDVLSKLLAPTDDGLRTMGDYWRLEAEARHLILPLNDLKSVLPILEEFAPGEEWLNFEDHQKKKEETLAEERRQAELRNRQAIEAAQREEAENQRLDREAREARMRAQGDSL